jgi:hypothetical protein
MFLAGQKVARVLVLGIALMGAATGTLTMAEAAGGPAVAPAVAAARAAAAAPALPPAVGAALLAAKGRAAEGAVLTAAAVPATVAVP